MGVIANIETGVVVSVKKIKINVKKAEDGTFAAMAESAAQAVSPGFLSEGTSRIASATGSLMDNKVDLEDAVRVRVKLDENKKLVEIIQLERPNLTFKIGQKVFISKGSTPGNLWIDWAIAQRHHAHFTLSPAWDDEKHALQTTWSKSYEYASHACFSFSLFSQSKAPSWSIDIRYS